MRNITILVILALLLSAIGCHRKKKELSAFARYQASAQTAIDALRELQTHDFNDANLDKYKSQLNQTEIKVNQFIQLSQTDAERASRNEIQAAIQDFRLTAELADRKRASAADQFFANKLFASTDADLFARVKQRYQLGPELVVATQPYYFIDSVIHEAWRSAEHHIDRAVSKLNEEAAADLKAAKAAKAAAKNGGLPPGPVQPATPGKPTQTPTPTQPSKGQPKDSAKTNQSH